MTFSTAVPASFVLTDGGTKFGTFTSTSITEASNVPGAVSIYILGNYTTGGYSGLGGPGQTAQASFTISLTQNPASTGTISDSATFSTPPSGATAAPEPATLVSAFVGLAIFGAARLRRKFAK